MRDSIEKQRSNHRHLRTRRLVKIAILASLANTALIIILTFSLKKMPNACYQPTIITGTGMSYAGPYTDKYASEKQASSLAQEEAESLANNYFTLYQCPSACPVKHLSRVKTDVRYVTPTSQPDKNGDSLSWTSKAEFNWYASLACN